jgi:DNA-binding response OmpR family regulator
MSPPPDSRDLLLAATETTNGAVSGRTLRVLVVEDEVLIALDTQETLADAGYEVVGPAERMDRALALAETEPLDGAILDVNLGREQIWPVADALLARGVPFVLLTGMASDCKVPDAHREAPLVAKPILPDALLGALAKALKISP